MKKDVKCMGIECPVKNQCLRYRQRYEHVDKVIRKCISQKLFLQDETNINDDSLRR